MFKIENVGMPDQMKKGAPKKYPFAELEVGQSFLVPGKKATDMSPTVRYWRKQTGWQFTCRSEETGVRIYRFA